MRTPLLKAQEFCVSGSLAIRRKWNRIRPLTSQQWTVLAWSITVLPVVQLWMRLRGLDRTARRMARWSDLEQRPFDPDVPFLLAEPIAIVAGRPIVGSRCLGRSLLLWFLLRRKGIDAELVIGSLAPADGLLAAHAWVEVAGVPVNDEPRVRDRYGSFGLTLPRLRSAPPPPSAPRR